MAAARQFADVLGDAGGRQRGAVHAGVMAVGVPDEDRRGGGDLVELLARQVAALQQVVEVGGQNPLALRRRLDQNAKVGDQVIAGLVLQVADIGEQLEIERRQDRVVVRVDEARKQGAALQVDDLGIRRRHGHDVGRGTQLDDLAAAHRDGFGGGGPDDRDDFAALEDGVDRAVGRLGAGRAATNHRQAGAQQGRCRHRHEAAAIGRDATEAGEGHRALEQRGIVQDRADTGAAHGVVLLIGTAFCNLRIYRSQLLARSIAP